MMLRLLIVKCVFMLSMSFVIPVNYSAVNNTSSSSGNKRIEDSISDTFNTHLVRRESFENRAGWKQRYPECDPEKNAYTSPIKIEPRNVVLAPGMKAIFVHSRLPVNDCLYLSSLYKERDFEMEAGSSARNTIEITINALPACTEQLAFISGGGSNPIGLRYFKRAVFFFTSTASINEQSFHQVNGIKFPMEILFEFVAANQKDYTQLFLLVEAKSPGEVPVNPIFTVLEPSLQKIKQEIIDEVEGKTKRILKLKELEADCKIKKEEYRKIENVVKNIFETRRLQKVETVLKNIKGVTNKDLERLSGKVKGDIVGSANKTELSAEEKKVRVLQDEMSTLYNLMQEETEQWAIAKLKKLYERAEHVIFKKMENVQGDMENIKELLKANMVGIPGESSSTDMLYKDPDAVHKDLLDIRSKINTFAKLSFTLNRSCEAFAEFQKTSYLGVRIKEPFQISWLFPYTGGYYIYNGSSPIPECKQRRNTIVFEKPISITSEQLSIFQNLPSLIELSKFPSGSLTGRSLNAPGNGTTVDKDKIKPIVYNEDVYKPRTVWHVSKHPIFLNDDGFHLKSEHVLQSAGYERYALAYVLKKLLFVGAVAVALDMTYQY